MGIDKARRPVCHVSGKLLLPLRPDSSDVFPMRTTFVVFIEEIENWLASSKPEGVFFKVETYIYGVPTRAVLMRYGVGRYTRTLAGYQYATLCMSTRLAVIE